MNCDVLAKRNFTLSTVDIWQYSSHSLSVFALVWWQQKKPYLNVCRHEEAATWQDRKYKSTKCIVFFESVMHLTISSINALVSIYFTHSSFKLFQHACQNEVFTFKSLRSLVAPEFLQCTTANTNELIGLLFFKISFHLLFQNLLKWKYVIASTIIREILIQTLNLWWHKHK